MYCHVASLSRNSWPQRVQISSIYVKSFVIHSIPSLKMADLITEYLTAGNVVLVIVCALLLHFIYEFYQFRDMPPGPRFTNLPFIGNLLSFDLKADDFAEATAR